MNITLHTSQIRTLKQEDKEFYIRDKLVTAPRAGFEISLSCPREYRQVIAECVSNGWLKPVANLTEREMLFAGLSNDR